MIAIRKCAMCGSCFDADVGNPEVYCSVCQQIKIFEEENGVKAGLAEIRRKEGDDKSNKECEDNFGFTVPMWTKQDKIENLKKENLDQEPLTMEEIMKDIESMVVIPDMTVIIDDSNPKKKRKRKK